MVEVQNVAESIKNINSLKINHGLIISAEGVRHSKFSAYSLSSQPKARKLNMPLGNSFQITLKFSTKQRDSFLFKNHIDHSAVNLKHCDWITVNPIENPLTNESLVKDVCLKIQCSKLELIVEKEKIKPSKEMVAKIKEALNHYDPYNELMAVFETYGKFLPRKFVLGHKIHRVTRLIVNESHPNPNFKEGEQFTNFMTGKYHDILSQWEKYIGVYGFDSSYFASVDKKLIMKDEIEMWMKTCLESDYESLQIISWNELYPIYEIFDEPLCQEIKSILGINYKPESFNVKEKVLFSGIIPVNVSPFSYRVNFPVCFKSNDYQLFGKLLKQNGQPIDKVIIKFKSMDIYGFYAFVESFDTIDEHRELQIEWILIGIPAKIGFFNINTRNIRILSSISTSFSPKPNDNNWKILLDVQEILPQNSVLVTSFKYSSNYERNFKVDDLNYWYNDNKIELNVYDANNENSTSSPMEIYDCDADNENSTSSPMEIYDSDENNFKNSDVNDAEPKCLIQCFILSLESREKLAIHLNVIGKTIGREEEITIKLQTGKITPFESQPENATLKRENCEEKGLDVFLLNKKRARELHKYFSTKLIHLFLFS
ncbi:28436_t:CDS:2 [Dentiscutata erythropus]|uniref:28436_t:CDS:1 n=1 Tax=Dentiscutata erythropus TaxID=1348616 RepID=A0A9N9BUE1_9GLOM|nr:28436_t:CDS:2 [Dentiscutata erythropus]